MRSRDGDYFELSCLQIQLHLAAQQDLGHSDLCQQGREGDGGSPCEDTQGSLTLTLFTLKSKSQIPESQIQK